VLLPIVRALARRIDGKGGPEVEVRDELERLRTRVGELEAQHGRLAELEERLDFAERLLVQHRTAPGLSNASEP
jgi:hypothetical protein